jgi:hypothetical protein
MLQQRQLLCSIPSSCTFRCCVTFCAVGVSQQLQPFAALQQQLALRLQPALLNLEALSKQQLVGQLQDRSKHSITLF